MLKLGIISIFLCYMIYVTAQIRTNFEVNRLEFCAYNKDLINVRFLNVTKGNGRQYLNLDMMTFNQMGDNVHYTFLIEHAVSDTIFMKLFTIDEKNPCKGANRYLGEFWYDIERSAQLAVGVCPIYPGHYHVHHHQLDFKKIKLQTFPFGKLRFTLTWIDVKNRNNILFCAILEVDNVFN